MNYWWVNHKQTFKDERLGNYIWSPRKNSNGSKNETYLNLTRVQPGDSVFSYANGSIGAIGLAKEKYIKCDRPLSFGEVGEQWDRNGWKVSIEWIKILQPISPKSFINEIAPFLPKKNSPIQKSGKGNQNCGYSGQLCHSFRQDHCPPFRNDCCHVFRSRVATPFRSEATLVLTT